MTSPRLSLVSDLSRTDGPARVFAEIVNRGAFGADDFALPRLNDRMRSGIWGRLSCSRLRSTWRDRARRSPSRGGEHADHVRGTPGSAPGPAAAGDAARPTWGPGWRETLAHGWLKEMRGPNFNLYLLLVVLGILAAGVIASRLRGSRAAD